MLLLSRLIGSVPKAPSPVSSSWKNSAVLVSAADTA
ncbi:Uncharacterised protein [Bordetella pertussis]|nr:Uncharacterised protein [Bordetella pertussis]